MDDVRELERDSTTETDGAIPAWLFPLPVSPLELFLIADDTDKHPMSFFIQSEYGTQLNQTQLTAALHQTIRRNPLLACRLDRSKRGINWVYDEAFFPQWKNPANEPILVDGLPRPFELDREPGSRFWYEATSTGTRLVFQVHHACIDGIGARRLLLDLLLAYAHLTEPSHLRDENYPKLDRLQPSLLRSRFDTQSLKPQDTDPKLSLWQRVRNVHYFLFHKPHPLVGSLSRLSPKDSKAEHSSSTPYLLDQIDLQTSARIFERAQSEGLSLADIGVSLLFHVCRQWNEERGISGSKKRIRLLLPFDLRSKDTLRMPAANKMSFAFIGRTHSQCESWSELLQGVQREMQWIKDNRVYADLLFAFEGLAAKGDRLMRWVVGRNQNIASAVLTYSGDVYRGLKKYFPDEAGNKRIGDSWLLNVSAAPPVRPNTNIAMGLFICRDQLFITTNWNRHAFTESDARAFVAAYRDAWYQWSASGGMLLP